MFCDSANTAGTVARGEVQVKELGLHLSLVGIISLPHNVVEEANKFYFLAIFDLAHG